jgi:hypothetical protein
MAVSTNTSTDLAEVIVGILDDLSGVRAYAYISDLVRPPTTGAAIVVAQPTIDYEDTLSGFCSATWIFPVTLVVARGDAQSAQRALSQYLHLVTTTLATANPPDVQVIEPVDARPTTVTVSGVEQPGYVIQVRIRA